MRDARWRPMRLRPAHLVSRALPLVAWAAMALATGLGCASPPLATATADEPSLTVLNWNLNYGLAGDPRALELLAATDADLILLQETTPAWEHSLRRALAARYPFMSFHHCCGAGGLAVLSTSPIVDEELIRAVSWFPAWRGVVATSLGPVQVLNVHLRPPFDDAGSIAGGLVSTPAIREREMTRFAAELDDTMATLVAGDFNEGSGGALEVLRRRGMQSALERAAVSTATWRWPGVPLRLRLDHVFYDQRGLALTAAEVVDAGGSDHLPVRASFVRVAPSAAAARRPAYDREPRARSALSSASVDGRGVDTAGSSVSSVSSPSSAATEASGRVGSSNSSGARTP